MKSCLILFCFLSPFIIFSQKKETSATKKRQTYVSLKFYRSFYKKELTAKDSLNFKIKGNDTLVLVQDDSKVRKFITKHKDRKKNGRLISKTTSQSYMSLKQYKKIYKREITDTDVANFKFKDNDTLILISNKDFYKNRKSIPYEPKDSTFLEIYKDIVFQKHSNRKNINKFNIRYWKNDIRIFFTKNVNRKVKRKLKKFAKYLSKNVDSLNIRFVNNLEKSNYLIYGLNSDDDYKYEPRLKSGSVDYYAFWNGNQQIYDVKLQIDSRSYDNEKELILKSKEYFLRTLGHFNYTYMLPKENYFSYRYSKNKKFTEKDLEILKYHYSYGICKGTDLKTFEDSHKKAKEIFKNTGKHMNFVHMY